MREIPGRSRSLRDKLDGPGTCAEQNRPSAQASGPLRLWYFGIDLYPDCAPCYQHQRPDEASRSGLLQCRCILSTSAMARIPAFATAGSNWPGTAAWTEMTKVCADLLGSASLGLKQDSEWSLELLDEAKKHCSECGWWQSR
jgi:hypothetical protein